VARPSSSSSSSSSRPSRSSRPSSGRGGSSRSTSARSARSTGPEDPTDQDPTTVDLDRSDDPTTPLPIDVDAATEPLGDDDAPAVQPRRRSRSEPTRSHRRSRSEPTLRDLEKARTRRSLLDGALDLLADRSLDNLGIREVTRAAGVAPAAFYRHFDRIEDLGLVLVDEAFSTLRQLMRDARDEVAADDVINRSVAALVRHVHDHRAHYRFLCREQYSAVVEVRTSIRREIRLFATELATDLARFPQLRRWPTEDLVLLADLIVGHMVDGARRILDAVDEAPEREPEVIREIERRLLFLAVAGTTWKPRTA
jgi:AcrR family transcriptional regulator